MGGVTTSNWLQYYSPVKQKGAWTNYNPSGNSPQPLSFTAEQTNIRYLASPFVSLLLPSSHLELKNASSLSKQPFCSTKLYQYCSGTNQSISHVMSDIRQFLEKMQNYKFVTFKAMVKSFSLPVLALTTDLNMVNQFEIACAWKFHTTR